ncbi:MAG: sodium:solute symporter [Saprospiraceae bacterium]|nr:sodium:solute symporter [Saprospiraceae bacterium]
MAQLTPTLILTIIGIYFLMLIVVSYFTSKGSSDNANFFIGSKQSPWYVVAFGMVGATLSGVTFISIPGVVGKTSGGNIDFSYMQVVFGYLIGYILIANILLPVYYRLNLTSIYTYLEKRFGISAYKTGAAFFILSRVIGSAFRLYLVAIVLDTFVLGIEPFNVPFEITVIVTIALIWLYTFRGGIKTIVWTDSIQTFCMLAAVVLTVLAIGNQMELSVGGLISEVRNSDYSQMFFFKGGWSDPNNFFKQFFSGASLAFVMTGLDQDMMQKNLSCRNIKDAQKNMYSLSIILIFVNLLFLTLGALLYIYANNQGIAIPEQTDKLFPTIALNHLSPVVGILFILGLIAAAYSSADSALTALTTSFCVDFLNFEKKEDANNPKYRQTRNFVHIGFSVLLILVIIIFKELNDDSVINELFKIAGYTYGPLLGLYVFGFFTKFKINDKLAPVVCVLSPIVCYFLSMFSETLFFGYQFGFELLILNGLLTFFGLWLIRDGKMDGTVV